MLFNSTPPRSIAAVRTNETDPLEDGLPPPRHGRNYFVPAERPRRYNDLAAAIADGYANINVFIPQMVSLLEVGSS